MVSLVSIFVRNLRIDSNCDLGYPYKNRIPEPLVLRFDPGISGQIGLTMFFTRILTIILIHPHTT